MTKLYNFGSDFHILVHVSPLITYLAALYHDHFQSGFPPSQLGQWIWQLFPL